MVNKRIAKLFKWIGSNERFVRESNISKTKVSDEHSQCCAAGVSNGGWSAKRPTLHINDFYWNKHSSKINEYVKIFESFTFQIFVQDLGLKLTIFNSTPNSVYFYQKIKKGCGTVPWYSDVNTMVYTMVLKCSYVVFTRVHIRVHFCHLLVKHCKCLLILGFNVCILQ